MSDSPPPWADGEPVDSAAAWQAMNEWLPEMLDDLLQSESFGEGMEPPADAGRGVYLFSDGTRPLYVGRTSITAHARSVGRSSTSFRSRWRQHSGEDKPPNAASFALKLAKEFARLHKVESPAELKQRFGLDRTEQWFGLRNDPEPPEFCAVFTEAKRYIREDLSFKLVAFDDDVRGVRSHVAEVYADVVLQTPYNDFSPS